ncbi:MAG: hypothetical protein P8X79_18780 [Reinekea sp.]
MESRIQVSLKAILKDSIRLLKTLLVLKLAILRFGLDGNRG